MSPLEAEFNQAITECVHRGTNLQLLPAEIFEQLNALLADYNKKVANAGWTADEAIEMHGTFVAMLSELVVGIATYNQKMSDAEMALIGLFERDSVRCLSEESMALGLNEEFKSEFRDALSGLYRRGLLRDDERSGFVRLTSAGEFFVEAE
jgi:hypothetical protein